MWFTKKTVLVLILLIVAIPGFVFVSLYGKNTARQNEKTITENSGTFLLTVFLKHDQSKTLDEIQKKLNETGFYKKFPPAGIEVESWKIVMGIGQVVTLRVPPGRLREVNTTLEKYAWGSYRTEFYPTYDYLPIYQHIKDSLSNKK